MIEVLNAAEESYKDAVTPFELKNCFTHLRSFLEHLHRTAALAVMKTSGLALAKDNWGTATAYLRQHGFFTQQHEEYVTSLYKLISDTSVHPLGADREYARLLRNMVIEYGVMFLSMLGSKGVKI